ncbi:MAG: cyanophycin synthetase [Gaiellaceae bacterium]
MPALDGRKLWFVGIGGAGMSALAVVTRAWGAEVAGWDRQETPYLDQLDEVEIAISPSPPSTPTGWEPVVSTAYADLVAGQSRGELLAELVSLRRSIVVAGAHGKTTTAAMIAFCLHELGRDPAFLIGGAVPQLGANARAGDGWLVAEGDESDRSLELLRPEIGVLTNVDLDHHSTFASRHEVEELFASWLGGCGSAVRGDALEPVSFELAIAGDHNRRNAAAALAALELAGVEPAEAAGVLGRFRGAGRRLELRGAARGLTVYDDYAHHPSEIEATLAAIRELHPGARVLVLYQPHLYSRTRHLSEELGAALSRADAVCLTEIYAAREQPVPGVTGKLVVNALARGRPGMWIGWAPELEDAGSMVARLAHDGDVAVTMGAGNVDDAASVILGELGG